MAKIKKNLSLEETLVKESIKRAKELGYTFSSYVTYLLNEDLKRKDSNVNIVINNTQATTTEEAITKENTVFIEKPKQNNIPKLDDTILGSANNILDM